MIAGPDKPPLMLLKIGRVVSESIAMAFNVFTAVKASAPASTAALADTVMSATFGDSFTMTGLLTGCLHLFNYFVKEDEGFDRFLRQFT